MKKLHEIPDITDPEAQQVNLVSDAAVVKPKKKVTKFSEEITSGIERSKVGKSTIVKERESEAFLSVEKDRDRADYPVSLFVMKMIDARTINIPNYGSLTGRIARLVAIIIGKEKSKENAEKGEKKEGKEMKVEDRKVTLHCFKCDNDLEGSYTDIMPHLEAKHGDFVKLLGIIFPSAKRRLAQFVEKAAENFYLVVPTETNAQKLILQEKYDEPMTSNEKFSDNITQIR